VTREDNTVLGSRTFSAQLWALLLPSSSTPLVTPSLECNNRQYSMQFYLHVASIFHLPSTVLWCAFCCLPSSDFQAQAYVPSAASIFRLPMIVPANFSQLLSSERRCALGNFPSFESKTSLQDIIVKRISCCCPFLSGLVCARCR